MKTCLKVRLAAVALLASVGMASTASAINVTYQVNMSVQTAIGKFNPVTDTMFVSGNFSNPDWQYTADSVATNYTLSVSAGDSNIYEGTFAIDVAPTGWENHKFVINRGGTYGNLKWETGDDRYFQVPATDTNLPVVFFSNEDIIPPTREVTFQVDMSVQTEIALTNFNPATDFVNVAGDFNDWDTTISELSQSVTNTNVYVGTFIVAGLTNTVSAYKFVKWTFAEGEVYENNGVGAYGPNGDRGIVLAATNQIEPLVCFNNQCSLPYDVPVTFRVNMAAQTAYGNFADGVNPVTAAGSFNDWDPAGFVLTNVPGEPYVYQGTTNISGAEDQSFAYKYVIDGGATNELWEEDIADRTFIHGTNSLTLETAFFDDVSDLGQVNAGPAAGNQVDVSWNPGALVRLQLSTNLANGWVDVPSTTGESNATVTITTEENYFRLIGP